MIRERGNMWSIFEKTDNFVITTNSYVRADGKLVMGRGIAKQMAKRLPFIQEAIEIPHLGEYHLQWRFEPRPDEPIPNIWLFQVKRHFREEASLELIHGSAQQLKYVATGRRKNERFDLNFPGIGNGKLEEWQVLPLLIDLPDNVHIWSFR